MKRFTSLPLLLIGCTSGQIHHHLNVVTDDAVLPVAVHGNIDDGTLVLVESGGPSGAGIAERNAGYMPFADTLEPQVAVAWYDRRGTGNALGDYTPDDQSLAQLISDLDAVIVTLVDRYAPDRLVLLGHSFGTYTSGVYLLDRPGTVDGWVAAAPAFIEGPDELYIDYRRDYACRVAADQIAAGSTDSLWTEIEDFCAENPTIPPVWDTKEREQLWDYLGAIEERLEPWPAIDGAGLLGLVFFSHYNVIDTQARPNLISPAITADPGREDLLPELPLVGVPTAVVTGEFDGGTPTEMGDAMAAAIGALATLTEIPDGGHYMMADDPEAFADVVLALTARLD